MRDIENGIDTLLVEPLACDRGADVWLEQHVARDDLHTDIGMQFVEILDGEFRGDHVTLPGCLGVGAGHVAEDANLDGFRLRAGNMGHEQGTRAQC